MTVDEAKQEIRDSICNRGGLIDDRYVSSECGRTLEAEIERLRAELREQTERAESAENEAATLAGHMDKLDRFVDSVPIVDECDCWTPDGRHAYIEPFRSTPLAIIKHQNAEEEVFDGRDCYSTQESAEAAGGEKC